MSFIYITILGDGRFEAFQALSAKIIARNTLFYTQYQIINTLNEICIILKDPLIRVTIAIIYIFNIFKLELLKARQDKLFFYENVRPVKVHLKRH